MPITYRLEKGSPLTNLEVDDNFRDLDQRATANQQAASSAAQAAAEAGGAAGNIGEALNTHKASGDHDTRYLRRDVPDTAPLLSGIPEVGVDGLPADLDVLATGLRNALYGDGPYPSLDLRFVGATRLDRRVTFARGTASPGYYGARGLIEVAAADVPAFAYDPLTRKARGLRVSSGATNLLPWSDSFAGTGWQTSSPADVTVIPNAAESPSGEKDAVFFGCATTTSALRALLTSSNIALGAGTVNSMSVFLKPDGWRYVAVSFSAGTALTTNAVVARVDLETLEYNVQAGNSPSVTVGRDERGFVRVTATGTTGSLDGYRPRITLINSLAGGVAGAYAGVIGAGVLVWRAGLAPDAGAPGPIKTEGKAMSTVGDQVSVAAGDWYNPMAGTIVIHLRKRRLTTGPTGVFDLKGTGPVNSRYVRTYMDTATGIYVRINDGAGVNFTPTLPTYTAPALGELVKIAVSWRFGGMNHVAINGVSGGETDMSAAVPLDTPLLILGGFNTPAGGPLPGEIEKTMYFPIALTRAETEAFTA